MLTKLYKKIKKERKLLSLNVHQCNLCHLMTLSLEAIKFI